MVGGLIGEFWLCHGILQYTDDPLSFEVNFPKSPPFIPPPPTSLLAINDPFLFLLENHRIPLKSTDPSPQGNK